MGEPQLPVSGSLTPGFSAAGGLYTEALTLTLTVPEGTPSDVVIRYTDDGSVPTALSRTYTRPLSLLGSGGAAAGTVIRAACFDGKGNRLGQVITNSYVRVESLSSPLFTVMISVEESDLSDMMVQYSETIERPAHVEIVTPAGETVISQDAGLRLFGGSSRALEQKSFKLIARKDGYFGADAAYTGKGTFAYPLFADRLVKAGADAGKVLDKYDSFILRNGGNDSLLHTTVNPEDATLLRDGVVNNFAFTWTPHVDASLSQFAAVYVNGSYYGILDMRENLNEDYVKRLYGVDDDQVVVVKSELDTSRHCDWHANGGSCRFCNVWFYLETDPDAVSQAALEEWEALCRKAVDGMSATGASFDALFSEIADKVDLESFAEYMALGLYVCNTDWPHNNVKIWKYVGEPVEGVAITDGKWRFMTRDMDMAMGRYSSPEVLPDLDTGAQVDTFWRVLGNYLDGYQSLYENSGPTALYPDSFGLGGLFALCLKNAEFRADFTACARSLASEAAAADLKAAYNTAYEAVKPTVEAYMERWGISGGLRMWQRACRRIDTFIEDRPEAFLRHLEIAMSMYE